MTKEVLNIKNVTILGANGTMGRNVAAIFASFGNANVYLVSRTTEKSIRAKDKAYQSVRAESVKNRMIPADYSQIDECVEASDLIFEACAEDWDVKKLVHVGISKALACLPKDMAEKKIICSGTSGLSITKIAECYDESIRSNVIGMHFFNPPYQMNLCEIVPSAYSDREVIESVIDYASNVLRRVVVEVKDSPAFLGNRIGFQFINETMQLAEMYKFNGGIDYIDAIMGPYTGRAMSPLVTANFVGLDVHKAIVDNLYVNTNDFANYAFKLPEYVEKLVNDGLLGRKAGAGLYKTIVHDSGAKIHQVYDIENKNYREIMKYRFPYAEQMISYIRIGDYEKAFNILVTNRSTEAELCVELLIKYVLYSLSATEEVGYDIHSADDVMATGFNWCPPLAVVEALGGKERFYELCEERINDTWMEVSRQKSLLSNVEKSKYDYRRFIKAKR